jgi:hypothetical protein
MSLGNRRRVRCADEHEEITVQHDTGGAEWEASNLRARGLGPEQLREEIRVMLRAGRGVLPLLIAAERVAPDDSHAVREHAKIDDEGFHRLWATALFCRTLDGYDAVLRLHEARLDTEARAYCRIAFEHLLSFAWVVAKPEDPERPLRIARHGMGLLERQRVEMAEYIEFSGDRFQLLGLAIAPNRGPLPSPPQPQDLCRELDEELAPRIEVLRAGTSESFSAWYSHLYRGASGFIHPTSAGIEPLIEHVPGGFQVASSRAAPDQVIEVVAGQLAATLMIAREAAPWLVAGHVA